MLHYPIPLPWTLSILHTTHQPCSQASLSNASHSILVAIRDHRHIRLRGHTRPSASTLSFDRSVLLLLSTPSPRLPRNLSVTRDHQVLDDETSNSHSQQSQTNSVILAHVQRKHVWTFEVGHENWHHGIGQDPSKSRRCRTRKLGYQ